MDSLKFVRTTIIIWFLIINIIVIVWSLKLLSNASDIFTTKAPPPSSPILPVLAAIDSSMTETRIAEYVKYNTHQVEAYKKNVEAYTSQLASYNKYLESNPKSGQYEVYKTVVKETLTSLITGIAVAFITAAFAKFGLEAVSNYMAVKNGQPPQPFSSFF